MLEEAIRRLKEELQEVKDDRDASIAKLNNSLREREKELENEDKAKRKIERQKVKFEKEVERQRG